VCPGRSFWYPQRPAAEKHLKPSSPLIKRRPELAFPGRQKPLSYGITKVLLRTLPPVSSYLNLPGNPFSYFVPAWPFPEVQLFGHKFSPLPAPTNSFRSHRLFLGTKDSRAFHHGLKNGFPAEKSSPSPAKPSESYDSSNSPARG